MLGILSPLMLAARARAAAPLQATAQVARPNVQVGEPVRITIRVKDCAELPRIDAPTVEGMTIRSTDAQVTPSVLRNVRPLSTGHLPAAKLLDSLRDLSKQLDALPGGMPNPDDQRAARQYQGMLKQGLAAVNRGDYTIVYLATPDKIGPLTVPAFTVHSGAQTVETKPIQLNVTEARPSPWVKGALSLSNPKPLVGDTVNLYVDLLVRRWPQQTGRGKSNFKSQPIADVMLTVPSLEGLKEVKPLQSLQKFVENRRLPPGQPGYHINRYPGVILLEQEPPPDPLNPPDPQWYRRRLTIPFRAVGGGEVTLPPMRVAGEVYVSDDGKQKYHWEGFVTASEPLKFRIHGEAVPPRVTPAPAPPAAPPKVAEDAPAIEEGASAPEETPPAKEHSIAKPAAFLATLAAVAVLAGIVLGRRRRRGSQPRQPALPREQRPTIEQVRQRLHAPSLTANDVSAAVQDFLRIQLEMSSGEITPNEAAERLTQAGYPPELTEACAEVLRECATRQFAPGQTPSSANDLALSADRILGDILAATPQRPTAQTSSVDELTGARALR
jgi:hypothetical protein